MQKQSKFSSLPILSDILHIFIYAMTDMSYKQACSFHNYINFSSTSSIQNSISRKRVNKRHNDVMTYKLSQLGHDVQDWSVTVVHAVNVSTTRRRVQLSRYIANATQLNSTSSWVELRRYKRAITLYYRSKRTLDAVVQDSRL